ncbi:MAG: DNA-protecting protein DprA, partial [Firmicutes bacterium]|nr:DNA-protecting protein DprA [Bacillota bacterium]
IYGTQMAFDISYDLAKFGITIVSGGAVGIDSASHRGAIASNGKTVAVMACGIDYPYLLQNSKLREEVSNFGALVSEYPPGHPVQKFNFYTRNRIISGISSGTVVIEAAKRSGAILTANLAVEHNRDVFVVPVNQSSPLSEGPTELISDGARVITCALDVLEEYKHFKIKDISYNRISKNNKSQDNKKNNEKAIKNLSQQSILVFKSLKKEKIHIDELKKITGLPIQKLSSILTNLELLSLITSLPGKFYIKSIESDS